MSSKVLAEAHRTALDLHYAGRLPEAEIHYRTLLDDYPNHAPALNSLAVLLQQSGRANEALTLLRRAVELSPATAHFHSNLAGLLGRRGRYEEAIPHLREAIRLQPELEKAIQATYNDETGIQDISLRVDLVNEKPTTKPAK